MKILIICENYCYDQYIVQPIIKAMFEKLGVSRTEVRVCQDPSIRCVSQATDVNKLIPLIERYKKSVDIFLLCIDRDGKEKNERNLQECQLSINNKYSNRVIFLSELALQEIEVWILAGHDKFEEWRRQRATSTTGYTWEEIRLKESNPKEAYYEPFAKYLGIFNRGRLGGGRKELGEEAAKNYERIRRLCQEDVLNLENRIKITLNL